MIIKKYFVILAFLLSSINLFSQIENKGIPYIKNYTRIDYDGNYATYSIIQDKRGIMYFANQTYILEFDGKNWRKIFIPGDPNIYSLAKNADGKIFVGASVGEFGYLYVDDKGNMKYKSLKDKIPEDKQQFTLVREVIKGPDNEMIFITPLTLYIYQNDTIKTIDVKKPENRFVNPFEINGKIYIQEKGLGIVEYTKGKIHLLKGSNFFSNKWVVGMFSIPDSKNINIATWQDSVYLYNNGNVRGTEKNNLLKSLYKTTKYGKNYYIGGLYGNGMIICDKKLNVLKHLTTSNGLQNNTVFAVYTDADKNIWIGTNDGISVIYADLPYTVFSSFSNLTEVVYTSTEYNGTLYIGSSVGIFYKDFTGNNKIDDGKFKQVEIPQGSAQIWKIDTVNNTLLAASSMGLYQITENKADIIGPDVSVKSFIKIKDNKNIILATGGNGLSVFKFKEGKWKYNHTVKNFKGNFRHIEEDNDGSFWISDRSKGVFRLKLTNKLDSVITEQEFTEKDGLPSTFGNYVYKINNRIVFTTDKGVFSYNKKTGKMVKDAEFDKIFNRDIKITNLYQAKNGNIWFKEEIKDPKIRTKKYWELGEIVFKNGKTEIIKKPFYKVKNRINSINQISDNELIVGTESGFVRYNLNSKKEFKEPFPALIRKVEFIKNDSLIFGGAFQNDSGLMVLQQNPNKIPRIPFEFNDIRFSFSSVFYEEPEKIQYKFILQGNDTEWSDWKSKTDKEYSNLGPGSYTFIVKAKNLYNVESKTAEYTFEILPPWYRTFGAYLGYFVLFILFIYGIIQLSVARLKRQRENLKRIVEERTKEIQIQKEEIEAKNETLSAQNEEISQKNASITASINYAKRIQEAMLPLKEKISAGLPDNFILFKPRDIVSGDFYWYAEKNGKIVYTAVDCTGHGVPGALMSMIGSEILTTIVTANGITKADTILEKMNDYVIKALKQEKEGLSQDGMDMALCVIDKENKTVEFAGAKNPLIYITNGELKQVKASRNGIGGYQSEAKDFTAELIHVQSPSWFYMFSDGFQDQFGGPKNRKFMIKRLKQLLFDIHYKPMEEQHEILNKIIEEWMKDTPQTDDIILIGFKL